ncbi:acyltransferase family protein [Brotaphodocola sp.]|uniref:acyltransferase family protein n=1 Tax=Brotaphodocola sp. TaxID=3073577 RepID=UPI003D7DBA32
MEQKKQYYGLDVVKFGLALLVAGRHMIQVFYAQESSWRLIVGSWLSNLAVPFFFTVAGFLLFRKICGTENCAREGGNRNGKKNENKNENKNGYGNECESSKRGCEDGRGRSRKKAQKSGWSQVLKYCWRILKLYVLWCVIYWPIDIYNWYHGTASIKETVIFYIRSFFFSSTIAQLWYLPALITACLIVWCVSLGARYITPALLVTGALFAAGCLGDNWYFTAMLPQKIQDLIYLYGQHCMTMRNGIFYGSFYVCLGLLFAKKKKQLPFLLSLILAIFFCWVMKKEVTRCGNINIVISAAPTAYFLTEAALALRLPDWKLFTRLRAMSEWVYLSHFYFFYFFSWTAKINPLPLTEKNIMLCIFIPMLIFAWWMACLGEKRRWVRKLI